MHINSFIVNCAKMAVNPRVIQSRLGQMCVYILAEAVRHLSQDWKQIPDLLSSNQLFI